MEPTGCTRPAQTLMKQDVPRRIAKLALPPGKAVQSVFEAVQNSLDSVAEAGSADTTVVVRFCREPQPIDAEHSPVEWVEIEDDGIGFTEDNHESFWTADSSRKADRGGQGCGRFLWLKVFGHVAVDSVYMENSEWRHRRFTFSPAHPSPNGHDVACSDPNPKRRTIVRLGDPQEPYRNSLPRTAEDFARAIAEHFAMVVLPDVAPRVLVECRNDASTAAVQDALRAVAKVVGTDELDVEGSSVRVTHVELLSRGPHMLYLCAHNRVVRPQQIAKAELPNPLMGPDETPYRVAAYVTSPVLDEAVDPGTRSAFNLPRADELRQTGNFTEESLLEAVRASVARQHEAAARPLEAARLATLQERIAGNQRLTPFMAFVRQKPDRLRGIDPDMDATRLRRELSKREHLWKQECEDTATGILESVSGGRGPKPEDYARFREATDEIHASTLAHYVVHRRLIIDWATRLLRRNEQHRHEFESEFHNLVMPMRSTSHDPAFGEHNLWLIDERLTYKAFVASDKPLSAKGMPTRSRSNREPDLLAFEHPLLCRDPGRAGGFHVVEFKRPGEEPSSDPVAQVMDYVCRIREGGVESYDGTHLPVSNEAPVSAHIIADLTPKMRGHLERYDFKSLPDGEGFVMFHEKFRIWFEVSTYKRLLDDAFARNEAFFQRLKISGPVPG